MNRTLYYDVLYAGGKVHGLSRGYAVVEMETVDGREVRVDVEGGMRVNGFGRVVANWMARDGSVLVIDKVLIPPRKMESKDVNEGLESLMERLNCVRGHEDV
jgi:uncharacterized surface protein with fasciclin (FAS1) repeats